MNDLLEPAVNAFCRLATAAVPYPPLHQYDFLARAFVALALVAPLCAAIGIQVVHFRLAFFAEAVGHSAFTGLALGLLLSLVGVSPLLGMYGFGVVVALAIALYRRRSRLSSDTVIGVFSAAVVAFGLVVVDRLVRMGLVKGNPLEAFLFGNILTITEVEIVKLAVFFVVAAAFQVFAYNRLLFIGLNPALARTMGVPVERYENALAVLLALVVMFSIQAVGVLLVTALLVVPAAAARSVARSAGSCFWWGTSIALV
ncbi:MAG: metal ABC transporter permease, partial [Planctomycetia bacterium]